MALFGLDFSAIFDLVKRFLGPFGQLIDSLKTTYDKTVHVFDAAEKLKDSVLAEIDGWKNFKQDIRFSQRVIQLESAVQKTRDLIEGIPEAWRSVVDIVKQFREKLTTSTPAGEAAAEVEEVVSADAKSITQLLQKFPRLARGLTKLLGALALIIEALENVVSVIGDLQTIVDEIKRIRLEIEKLDTIFLSQSNKRKRLKLADGSTVRIRVGHLHG
jgi:methyl-accepting chemotaxis protein